MIVIKAYGMENNIPMHLANYMSRLSGNVVKKERTFKTVIKNVIENDVFDGAVICSVLNSHHGTTETFRPYKMLENGFAITATDPFGNIDIIEITTDDMSLLCD